MKFRISILFVVLFAICVLTRTVLFIFDDSPKWGSLYYPKTINQNKNIEITVYYRGIPDFTRIAVTLVFRNKDKKYLGRHYYKEISRVIAGSGIEKFSLPPVLPQTASQVRIGIGLSGTTEQKRAIVGRQDVGFPPIISRWIPVQDLNQPVSSYDHSLGDLLMKGYQTGYWKTKRGDFSFWGWAIALGYLLCFFVIIILLKTVTSPNRREKRFWQVVCLIMLFFSINKQLDLQMLAADIMRIVVIELHVYEVRRYLQLNILSLLISLWIGALVVFLYVYQKCHRSIILAAGGICLISSYLALRLISYHSVDAFLAHKRFGLSISVVMELSGIVVMILASIWYHSGRKRL